MGAKLSYAVNNPLPSVEKHVSKRLNARKFEKVLIKTGC
jgi:hypothetical protein